MSNTRPDYEAAATQPQGSAASGPRHRVLVVDDEESVRITTAAILEQEGYEVETANDGREALRKVERDRIDLVLTDLRMEDMDGIALLHELQQRHPNIVSVVLTGYASIESSIDALRQGVYDYLVKPCIVEDLKRTVRRALRHREQRVRISELSSPVVEIWNGVLLLPIIGTLDDARAAQMSGAMLEAVRARSARVVLIDITGCTVVDTHTAAHLINSVRSAHLLGAATIITGISAGVASDLIKLGITLEDIMTRRRLADGLRTALEFIEAAPGWYDRTTMERGSTATGNGS